MVITHKTKTKPVVSILHLFKLVHCWDSAMSRPAWKLWAGLPEGQRSTWERTCSDRKRKMQVWSSKAEGRVTGVRCFWPSPFPGVTVCPPSSRPTGLPFCLPSGPSAALRVGYPACPQIALTVPRGRAVHTSHWGLSPLVPEFCSGFSSHCFWPIRCLSLPDGLLPNIGPLFWL